MIKEEYNQFVSQLPAALINLFLTFNTSTTSNVRELCKTLFESTVFDHSGIIGGNNSSESLKCKIKDQLFLIPPQCR